MNITTNFVRETLSNCMESIVPDAGLAVLRAEDKKPLTKRLLAKLPGGEAEWSIRHVAGMTNLENRAYGRTSGGQGISLLLAYAEKSVTIDAAWVEEKNAGYFAARKARNEERKASAASLELCSGLAGALSAVQAAREALRAAEAQLDTFVDYGKPFSADQYTWKGLVKGEEK